MAQHRVAEETETASYRAAFVHDFVHVARSFAQVEAAIYSGDGTSWIAQLADRAYRDGEDLRIRIGPGSAPLLSKRVLLALGTPRRRQDALVIPLHWQATGPTALFPVMDADLEIAPLGPSVTQVSLMGRYQVPLGALGKRADELLLHRVAEASVRSFLIRLARALETSD